MTKPTIYNITYSEPDGISITFVVPKGGCMAFGNSAMEYFGKNPNIRVSAMDYRFGIQAQGRAAPCDMAGVAIRLKNKETNPKDLIVSCYEFCETYGD